MTPKQRAAIEAHGRNLLAIFPDATERDPVNLCRKLRRIETCVDRRNVEQCSVGMPDGQWERLGDKARADLCKLLGIPVDDPRIVINGDPRGHALKIDCDHMRPEIKLHRDWGGYGIIAPEIDRDGN